MKQSIFLAATRAASTSLLAVSGLSHAISTSMSTSLEPQSQASTDSIEVIQIAGIHQGVAKPLVAGAVTVIDKQVIDASGAVSIVDLLRTVPGVNLGQTGGTGSLSEVRFRGAESNHMLVVIDGIAVNDLGQGNLVDFAHIQLHDVEKIEVLKGPQSALWGTSAIGGVISITTTKQGQRQPSGRVSLSVGNRDTHSAAVKIVQQIDKFGYHIGVSNYQTDGENISREGNEADGYQNTTVNLGANYAQDRFNSFTATGRLVDYTSDADAYDFATGLVGDAADQAKGKQYTLGFDWEFAPTENGNKQGIYSQLLSLQLSRQEAENFSLDRFTRSSLGETVRALWSNRFEFASDRWMTLGAESIDETFEQQEADPNGPSNHTHSTATRSLITSGFYAITDEVSLSGSYRYSKNSEFNDASSYRLGLNYLLGDSAKIYASRGKATQNPTFTERFGFFPDTFLGNPNLTPEQQVSDEIGVEMYFNDVTVGINYFNATLDDEILGFVFDANSGQFTATNADTQSSREGVEISVSGSFRTIDVNAQYSYLDAQQAQQAELRRARHTGSVSAIVNIDLQHRVYLQADYSGSKRDQFFPPFPQPSQIVGLDPYWLVSANYTYTYSEDLSVSVRITNATNSAYEDVFGFNTDSRRVNLSLQYAWR